MKSLILLPALLLAFAACAQYATDFEDWPITAEGRWSLPGPGGIYVGDGCYVNFGNENSGLRKVGFNGAGDALYLPPVTDPSTVSFWARLSSGPGASLDVAYYDGQAWITAATHLISSTVYDYFSADIGFAGADVPLRIGMSSYGNSVFLDDLSVSAFALPVELADFSAAFVAGRGAVLRWRTLTENGNEGFDIQRSRDGAFFETVGRVAGAGTSAVFRDYTFTDPQPHPGISYYRLRQVDFDGSEAFSELRSVMADEPAPMAFRIAPNVVTDVLQVSLTGKSEAKNWRIFDRNGLLVSTCGINARENFLSVDVSGLDKGFYFLQIGRVTQRFVKM